MTKYKVIGRIEIDDVLPYIGQKTHKKYKIKKETYPVYLNTKFLNLVKLSNLQCCCCGIKGDYFSLNQTKRRNLFTLNISNRTKHDIFTKDHIIPISAGGTNDYSNIQLLCSCCNNHKEDMIITLENLRSLIAYKNYVNTFCKYYTERQKKILIKQKKILFQEQFQEFEI